MTAGRARPEGDAVNLFKPGSNATNAFEVQRSNGTSLFEVDTTNSTVTVAGLTGSGANLTTSMRPS